MPTMTPFHLVSPGPEPTGKMWGAQPSQARQVDRPSEAREKTAGWFGGRCKPPPQRFLLHFYVSRLPKYRISSVPKHHKIEGQTSSKIT